MGDAYTYFLAFCCAHVVGLSWEIPASATPRISDLRRQLNLPQLAKPNKSIDSHGNRLVTVGRWTFPNSVLRTLVAFKRLGPHGYLIAPGGASAQMVPAHVGAQRQADEAYQPEGGYVTSYSAEFDVTSAFRIGITFSLWVTPFPEDTDTFELSMLFQCGESQQGYAPDDFAIEMDGLVLEPFVADTSAFGLQKGRMSYDGGFDCGANTGVNLQTEPIMALADGGQDLHVDAMLVVKVTHRGRPISFESARWAAINPPSDLGLCNSLQSWLNGPPAQATIADFCF